MIIASCGHKLNDFHNTLGNLIKYKEWEASDKSTIYSTVCDDCLNWYINEMDAILLDDTLEEKEDIYTEGCMCNRCVDYYKVD